MAALIVREGRILLAEHEKSGHRYFLLPGGGVEYGESLEEALKRELMEEAGLDIEVGDLLWTLDSIPPDGHRHVLNLIFKATSEVSDLMPAREVVLKDVRWVPIEDLPNLQLFPNTRSELLAYLQTGNVAHINLGKRWED